MAAAAAAAETPEEALLLRLSFHLQTSSPNLARRLMSHDALWARRPGGVWTPRALHKSNLGGGYES